MNNNKNKKGRLDVIIKDNSLQISYYAVASFSFLMKSRDMTNKAHAWWLATLQPMRVVVLHRALNTKALGDTASYILIWLIGYKIGIVAVISWRNSFTSSSTSQNSKQE